ncbi:uncharacterized protein KGF55_003834 [Candida pseudojiufengensis]|uniref:uncharacterized protein n=1 Tax=Candida pseudojiufengensis TaxID=497109 RepID=UPI002223F87E|nr:uncharacterized protein KGF55_003834 [Candida pseudojiufengensis]KAI5961863.1 hypothetical protein KGF55_003834 [Candida pseudojiufengensis]
MVTQRILNISNLKTASRHWIPIKQTLNKSSSTKNLINHNHISISNISTKSSSSPLTSNNHIILSKQFYSSKIRCINYNNLNDSTSLVSNDDVFNTSNNSNTTTSNSSSEDNEIFEPTINSSEDIFTAGPVNRA